MTAVLLVITLTGCGAWTESPSEGDALRPQPVDVSIALDDGSTMTSSEGLVLLPMEASAGGEADCGAGLEFYQTEVRQLDLHSPAFLDPATGTRSVLDASLWLTWTDPDGADKMWNGVLSVAEWTDVVHSFDMLDGMLCTDSEAGCVTAAGSLTMSTWVPEGSEAYDRHARAVDRPRF